VISALTIIVLVFTVASALAFVLNLSLFNKAVETGNYSDDTLAVSVLIPARDEADGIRETINAVLANEGVELELVVLDDQSRDATAAIVREIAAAGTRVRLVNGRPLPPGWCGKQFACYQLAGHAVHDELLFVDADVRLAPDALRRMMLQRHTAGTDLLSGFPREIVGTLGEALLIPMIYIVLLTYLPFWLMRRTNIESASAGCGQLFLTTRSAYYKAGGHSAIRSSLHDGVTLPRTYRRAELTTDVFDASEVARCRMYHGWSETWAGLSKNASEGIANARLILPFTLMMLLGYVAPVALAIQQTVEPSSNLIFYLAMAAAVISYLPRVITAFCFDRSLIAPLLSPVSILLFLGLQWVAFGRRLMGTSPVWRGRAYATKTA